MRFRSTQVFVFTLVLIWGAAATASGPRLYTHYNNVHGSVCADIVIRSLPTVVYEGAGSLILAPHSQRYLVGALAETTSGRQYLTTAPYRVQHESLLGALEWSESVSEIEPFRIVWMGELLIVNPTDERTMGQISTANETAGLFARLCAEGPCPHTNDVARLKGLMKAKPGFFLPNARFVTYRESVERNRNHLLPGLDVFIRTLDEKFAAKELDRDGSNYRHLIRTHFTLIAGHVQMLLQRTEGQQEFARCNELANYVRSRSELERESVRIYLGWFENDPKREEAALRLETYFARIHNHQPLSLQEWFFVQDLLDDITLMNQAAGTEAGDAMLVEF